LVALPKTTQLGNFSIISVLGQGGFGITYLAQDDTLDRHVAIKEYFPQFWANRDQTDSVTVTANAAAQTDYNWGLKSFLTEAKTLARFKHPSIVHVNRILEANGTAYMILDYEDGDNFSEWLDKLKRPPTQGELDAITERLLDALSEIHSNKLLHRDIAPDNIYIRKDGTPVLLDFGSAREAIERRTKTVTGFVKRGYSPMEQRSQTTKHQGPWTDIYAFGATLYRAISGEVPQDAQDRLLDDELVPAVKTGAGKYRKSFLFAIDQALELHYRSRPKSVNYWEKVFNLGDSKAIPPETSETRKTPKSAPDKPDDSESSQRRKKALAMMQQQLTKEGAPQNTPPKSTPNGDKGEKRGAAAPSAGSRGIVFLIALPPLAFAWALGYPFLALAGLLLTGLAVCLNIESARIEKNPTATSEEPEHILRARQAREKMHVILKREKTGANQPG